MVEEILGGAEQLGMPRHIAVADDAHPVALHQRLDDVRVHGDAADRLDLGTGDGLPVGDERERLEQRARIALRALRPEARHLRRELGAHLQAPAARHLAQLQRTRGMVIGDAPERLAQRDRRRTGVLVEQLRELGESERTAGCEQRGFDDVADVVFVHLGPSPGSSPGSSPKSGSAAGAAVSGSMSGTACTGGRFALRTCSGL